MVLAGSLALGRPVTAYEVATETSDENNIKTVTAGWKNMVATHSKEELENKLKEWSEYERKVREEGDAFRRELKTITTKVVYNKKDADRVAELVEEFAKVMQEMPAPLAEPKTTASKS